MALWPLVASAQAVGEAEIRGLLLSQPFPYEAKDVALSEMLHEMSQKTGLPVIVGEGVSGRAAVANVGGTVRDLLDRLTRDGRIGWWFDGAAVHVEGPGMVSRLLPLQGVRVADLREALRAVGLTANEYPILADDDARMVRIVAPPGYVEAVEQTITAMVAESAPKPAGALPVIIRGPGRPAAARGPLAPPSYAPGPNHAEPAQDGGARPYQTTPRKESR